MNPFIFFETDSQNTPGKGLLVLRRSHVPRRREATKVRLAAAAAAATTAATATSRRSPILVIFEAEVYDVIPGWPRRQSRGGLTWPFWEAEKLRVTGDG